MKNGEAPGIDGIQVELLKSGGTEMIERIKRLCNQVWKKGEVPSDWKDGIMIPLPQKGDLKDCTKWREITQK